MDIPVYKTNGIILKKADLSDTDRLLTVYTEKFGKILIRAKGIGKKESKLKALIEPFNIYEFMLARSRTVDVLAGSWPQKEFIFLRQNLANLSLAIYFAELVDKLIPAPEPDEKIWRLLERAMEILDKNVKSPLTPPKGGEQLPPFREGWGGFLNLKAAFEEKLLEFLGHPTFKMHGKTTEREKQNYLASLAGEEIKSANFVN